MAGYGRPLKGKTRRVPLTIHTAIDQLSAIDEVVEERNKQAVYSRSDFYSEAAELLLKQLGKSVGD